MSKPELIDERKIGFQFAVAISNSDITGLSDDEDLMLDDWYSQFGKNDYVVVMGDVVDNCRCDVTGFYSECVNVGIWRHHQ